MKLSGNEMIMVYKSKLLLESLKIERFFHSPYLPTHKLHLNYSAISDLGLNNHSSTNRVISAAKSSNIDASNKRVLIVDDEADIARFFKLALERAGFIVNTFDDPVNVCFITAYEEYYDEFKKRFPHSDKKDWFIRKPIGMEELISKVKSRLNY